MFEPYLTKDWTKENSHRIDFYLKQGGYKDAIDKLFKMNPSEVTELVMASGLRGRGGAGFSTGLKWNFVPKNTDKPVYLAVNADESEPGTFKDRYIIENTPHLLIEGIIITAYAINCNTAFIYIRGEFHEGYKKLEKAIQEAKDKGYLGNKIFGKDKKLDIVLIRGAGAYICGEETALLSSIEGSRGNPKLKPPFPAVEGLFSCPTIINNVETIANLPFILTRGVDWFKSMGTEKSPGGKLFCLSGHINNPGVYELELGTPIMDIINNYGDGVWRNKKFKAIIPGGISAPVIPFEECKDLKMDFESVAAKGSMLGSGAITVLDQDMDMLSVSRNIIKFFHHESCGQCTPCREGMGWLDKILKRIDKGNGRMQDLNLIEEICHNMLGRTICVLADAGALPILGILKHYRHELEAKIKDSNK